jgi:hypothetical protein
MTSEQDNVAKAKRLSKAINVLIQDTAEQLQKKDPTLTDAQARIQVRKVHPEWAERERWASQQIAKAAERYRKSEEINTVSDQIDKAINNRAGQLSLQVENSSKSIHQRRQMVRESDDGRIVMGLYRSDDAKRPVGSVSKSGEHSEAFHIVDGWLALRD